MLAALTCVAAMVIKIPSPLNGYLNLGGCIVLLSGWLLSPVYVFLQPSWVPLLRICFPVMPPTLLQRF